MKKVMGYGSWAMGLAIFLSFSQMGCMAQTDSKMPKNLREQKKTEDPNTWDFGQVKEGEILKHNFKLKNESKKILNIKDVNTSCGCTASKIAEKKLLPQEATWIEVAFNSKGYSGPTQQFVYVHTDALDNPIIRFIIKADVVKSSK